MTELQEVPGVGSSAAKRLREGRVPNAEVLALQNARTVTNMLKIDKEDAQVLIENARELYEIVWENPNRLMMDEKQVLKEKLGIMTAPYLNRITLFEGTGRLSSLWKAETNGNMDAIRAAILTTPDDIRKKRATEEWLRTRRDEVQVAKKKLEEEGLL